MSRIEEALRRARSATLENVDPPAFRAPAPPDIVRVAPAVAVDLDLADLPDLPDLPSVSDVPDLAVAAEVAQPSPASDVRPIEAPAPPRPMPPAEPRLDERADRLRDPAHDEAAPATRRYSDKLILSREMDPAAVEQYRKVAAALHQLQLDRGIKVVMIASAMAEDGKTITASNIALTLSESFRRRVLLIDADLRRPSIHTVFGTPNVTGLQHALQAERPQKLTIFEVTPNLSILPSGGPNPDPMSSLSSERMRMILDEAAAKFDWVVIDTPPVGILADAKLLAEMVHAVVLVIGAGKTPYRSIERAIEAIDRKRIAGVVLNRVTEQPAAYSYYAYYGSSNRG